MSDDDIGHLAHRAKQVASAEPKVLDNYEEGCLLGPDGAPIAYYVLTPRILNITYETDAAKDYIMSLLKNEKPK